MTLPYTCFSQNVSLGSSINVGHTFLQDCGQPQLPQLWFHAMCELSEGAFGKSLFSQRHKSSIGKVLAGVLLKPLFHVISGLVGEQQPHIASKML